MHAMLCHLVCSHQDKVIFPLDFSSILEINEKVQIHGSQSEMLSLVLKKKKKELRDLSESFDVKDLLSSTWKAS